MTIEDKRYSNATTITSSEADYDDDGYFASVVTVQHSQNSNKGTQDLEWKKVTWPSESEGLQHLQSHTSTVEGHETHHKVLHSNDFITKEKSKKGFEMEEKAFGWIHQVAETSHHLVSDAEMELQKRAFDVKHANDRSRSRTKSNFITNRARSFERAHIAGSNEALPPPLRRRSPSLRRNDEIWISRPESRSGEEEQMKNRHRWNSVGRLNTSAWENRIRCESPAPHPPPIERHLRRRRLTGEEMTPPPRSGSFSKKKEVPHLLHQQEGSQISGSLKDAKVTEWIRKSHDCLIQNEQNHQSYYETQESSTQSSQTTQHDVHNNESEAIRFRQEQLRHMEEEKHHQEAEIRRQGDELRRRELEMKKKELEMLRKKEEVQKLEEMNRLQAHMEKEEARLKKEYEITRKKRLSEQHEKKQNELMERRRQEDIRKQEEFERQRKYEEQLKQKHMEQERQKDQQLLYEKKIQKDKEERDRLHTLQMGQRQERIRKQQEKDENEKKIEQLRLEEERRCQEEMRQIEEETERQRRRSKKQNGHQLLDINKMEEQNITYRQSHHNQSTESRRHRSRHRSREGGCFNPQDQKEVHRPVTPIDVKTGHVNSKAHFFNERSKSMDRNDEYEPRRHRGHIVKDWIRTPQSEEHDPPSRPGSSLGQTLGAVKHTIDNWNHSALHQKTGVEPPVSRARSLSQHRDWKPCVRDRPVTPTCFDTVDTHKVQDTIKDWGANRQGSGRNSPIPSRMIAETFADSKVGTQEWKHNDIYTKEKETFYMEEDAPWRSKSTPEPNLKLINISVTRNVVKEKPKPKVEMIPPPLPKEHVEKCNRVQSRNLFITELPDLPLHQESTSTKYESKVMTSTTSSSQVHFEEKTPCDILGKDKNIPVPVVSESWLTGIQNSKPMSTSHNVLSTTSSASTIAHLEGLKSPTQTGKTPLPVLAGWYDTDSKKLPHSPKDQGIHHEVPRAPPPPLPSKETNPRLLNQQKCSPTIQKYENEVDKRQRELEELRNLRSARNKRLQDAFELGDPYLEYEESVESYSDDYTDDGIVEEGIPNEPSRPAPTRRIANLFNRSSDEWKEEQAHCPPLRNSSQEFMKGVNS